MKKPAAIGIIAILAWAVIAVAGVSAASAKKRIAVLDIEGARDASLRRSLSKLLRADHKVISSRTYDKAANRIGARRLSPDDVARVASRVEADGVLHGMIVAEDSRYLLRLRLREGASGRTVWRLAVALSKPRIKGSIEDKLRDRLLQAIESKLSALEADVSDDVEKVDPEPIMRRKERLEKRRARREAERREAERAEREARVEADDEDFREEPIDDEEAAAEEEGWDPDAADVAAEEARARQDNEGEDEGGRRTAALDEEAGFVEEERDEPRERLTARRERRDDTDDSPRSAAERARHGTLSLFVGGTLMSRELIYSARADLAEGQAPTNYKSPNAPGAHASGELYPLASGDRGSATANIGVTFSADQIFGLQTTYVQGTEQMTLPTTHSHFAGGLVYRYHIGKGATKPTVKIGAQGGRLTFAVARPADLDIDLPNVQYTYVAPSLALRVPLGGRLALEAGAKGMLVTKAGEITQPEQYGSGTITGVDGVVSLQVMATDRIVVEASGRYIALGYAFNGNGEKTVNRDGDAASVDVAGALDRYIGGSASVGYLF